MQLFGVEGRVERVALKQFWFGGGFSLNWSGQFFEEPIECGGG
jgi:hypothetical protein